MGIGLNSLQYGVLYLGSHYNTGPYIDFPHFGNSNLGKLPYRGNIRAILVYQESQDGPAQVASETTTASLSSEILRKARELNPKP